jgi:hypothetical protein
VSAQAARRSAAINNFRQLSIALPGLLAYRKRKIGKVSALIGGCVQPHQARIAPGHCR